MNLQNKDDNRTNCLEDSFIFSTPCTVLLSMFSWRETNLQYKDNNCKNLGRVRYVEVKSRKVTYGKVRSGQIRSDKVR